MYPDGIKVIHLEITDKCNASCPQCARNVLGGNVNPNIKQVELSLNDIKQIIPAHLVKNLKRLYLCGNYGDPILATDTLEVFSYMRRNNPNITLNMNTNGSIRSEQWWKELAKVINGKGNVKFGIDGLSDTHHLYRKGTNFEKVIHNAQAFINNGGKAHWEFLVFKHNEHQIDQAISLSKKLGFEKFTLKKTGRFTSKETLQATQSQAVYNQNQDIIYYLERPDNQDYQNQSLVREQEISQRYGSMSNYLNQVQVDCKTSKEQSIFINTEGLVFPCCWTGLQPYSWYSDPYKDQISQLIEVSGGQDSINAKKHSIETIISSDFFKRIKQSWLKKDLTCGKLKICAKTCGKEFDQFRDQYK